MQGDLRSPALFLTILDGVAVRGVARPAMGLFLAVFAGDDLHVLRHHEGRIEPDAELSDDVDIAVFSFLQLLLERQRSALGDRAQVFLQLFGRHAQTIVADGQGACVAVHVDMDLKGIAVYVRIPFRQGLII